MATLQEAQQQIAAAEVTLQAQREQAQTAQEKAQAQLRKLQTAQQKLPSITSQQALRQKMAGISGLIKRKSIAKVKEKLFGKKAEVEKYQKGIKEYREKLTEYEKTKLEPVRVQIKEAQEYDAAVKQVEKAADKGMVGLLAIYGEGLVKQLAQKYVKKQSIARESFKAQVSTFEAAHPGEKLQVDWKRLRIKGVQSGTLGETLSLKEYNKKIAQFKPEEIKMEEIAPTTIPPITEPVKVPSFLQKLKGAITGAGIIPLVSALPSDDRDLKRIEPPKVDGLSRITRDVIGTPMVSDSKLGDRISFIDRIGTIAKETFKEDQAKFTGAAITEYDPGREITTFVPPEKTFLQKAISIPQIGLASAREISERQEALVGAEALMGIGGVGTISGVDIPHPYVPNIKIIKETERLESQADKSYKNFQNLKYVEIPKFESKNRMNGQFDYDSLSKTKQNEYNRLIDRTNRAAQKAEDTSIRHQDYVGETSKTFRFLGYKKKVPVTQLTSPFGYVGTQVSTITEEMGAGAGAMYEDITSLTGKIGKQPFREIKQVIKREVEPGVLLKGKIEPDVVYDFLTGEARIPTKKDITLGPLTFVQPEEVAKVTAGVYKTGAYLLPFGVGAGIFAAEVGEELSQVGYDPLRLVKERPIETAFIGGALLGLGALRGVRVIKNKAIQKVITKEITAIEKQPIKSLTFVDEGTGRVYAEGIRKVGKIEQTVRYYGRIQQTEKGVKFIPSGEGGIVTTGIVKPKALGIEMEPKAFISGTEFEFGARGKDIFLGKIGDVKVFEELGVTTVIPKKDVFGITVLEKGKLTPRGIRELERQLKKRRPSIEIPSKDITIPTDERHLFFELKKDLGLRISPQEVGVVIKIPKKKPIDILGFKGLGKPSKPEFFKRLYAPQKLEKPILDLSIPKVSEIVAKVKTKVPKITTKTTFGIPSVSAYAGTGLYERTEMMGVSPIFLDAQVQPGLIERRDVLQVPKVIPGVGVLDFEVTKQREILTLKPKTKLRVLERPTTRVLQVPKVRTDLAVSQVSRVGQVTKPITRQVTETITGIRITPKPKPPRPKPPRPKPPKPRVRLFPLGKAPIKKRRIIPKKKKEEEFLGITKRYGKELIVGVGRTAKEAEMIAKKDVLGTLAATVKVRTKAGRQIQLTPGKFFRQSRIDPLAIVQRKTRRLSAIGERIEIAKARKRKPRKTKKKVVKKKRFSLK